METDRQLPLLRTKLYRPPVPADHVHRSELVERLEKNGQRPLILVSAPAGYGKSTLISCWLEECERSGAWLSLDENDNDLRQFLSYFVAAVQTLFPEGIRDTEFLIQASNLPPIPVLAVTLVNELDRIEHDFILVLDDIHCIHEKFVQAFLDFLLRHPPKPMQLVVIGRRDPVLPIASLRARGLLTELGMNDLRLTTNEALKFLGVAMGRHIEKTTAEALVNKAEGWVTGLRLAVLAMRGQDIPGESCWS